MKIPHLDSGRFGGLRCRSGAPAPEIGQLATPRILIWSATRGQLLGFRMWRGADRLESVTGYPCLIA